MRTPDLIRFVLSLAFLVSFAGNATAEDSPTATHSQDYSLGSFQNDKIAGPVGGVDTVAVLPLLLAGDGFACGPDLACSQSTQYCAVTIGGPAGAPPGYRCIDVPDASPWPTCASIPDIGVGCECAESDGGVRVTCTAP